MWARVRARVRVRVSQTLTLTLTLTLPLTLPLTPTLTTAPVGSGRLDSLAVDLPPALRLQHVLLGENEASDSGGAVAVLGLPERRPLVRLEGLANPNPNPNANPSPNPN